MWPEAYDLKGLPHFVRRFSKALAVGEQRKFSNGFTERGDFLWGAGLCVREDAN